ncbi:hypothetical protein YH65_06060 [Sulfurovum lithotrophicum]|uniref:Uncharacterized protein n=1 Tax=Sulfurovum lithotrophicum TaxID=206403 RepID=A0A7U4M176_9BACT|nr:hypothetical protein [Sulfurovum lithotrophicum]AKF25004.1 hypothetical protein YH65_06060 [Sulfurovum lithotrophicum]
MGIFALQSLVGGFLDEDLKNFNKVFDDWCVQFESIEDAQLMLESLEKKEQIKIVEITPLSYPKYFFPKLQGIIHATREYEGKIICVVEPQMGASFRIAICDLETKRVRVLGTRYKSALSAEGAFANLSFTL